MAKGLVSQPERFLQVLQACECDARGRLGFEQTPYPQAERLRQAQAAALSVDTAPLAQAAAAQGLRGPQIGHHIAQHRTQAIRARLA
jgi:tRNA nucleotidyltransferase (CCA-adding enzyme)